MLHRLRASRIFVAAGLLFGAGHAIADGFYSGVASIIDNSGTVHSASPSFLGTTQFVESTYFGAGSAFVQADYVTGFIRESAQSIATSDTTLSVFSSADVGMTAGITFAGAGSADAAVNWHMDGTANPWNGLTSGANLAIAELTFQSFDYTTGITTAQTVELSNLPFTGCDANTICVTGSNFNLNGSFLFPVHAGSILLLTVNESVNAYDNGSMNLSQTTDLSLSVPDGLNITSQGQFLTGAAPIPEPQTALLLSAGLGFLAASRMRAKRGRR